jgi:hypothetical protein
MSDKPQLTVAALAALMAGDGENFIAAATPGGIEAQEVRGQAQFVNSDVLPKRCIGCTREQIEAMGVVFGADVDDIFVIVVLPAGWAKAPTEHSMWSDLRDERGRVRANIFYKAAFYDRNAHISLTRYVNLTRSYDDNNNTTDARVVNAEGRVLFATERVVRDDYETTDRLEAAARAYADEHYPDWQNPLAYW